MDLILAFIVQHMEFLWRDARFVITGSTVANTNGGSAELFVGSDKLQLRFLCDRRQLMLDFHPAGSPPKPWFSSELIWRLILGSRADTGLLDAEFARFFEARLGEIEEAFSPGRWDETRAALMDLRRIRAKEQSKK